MPARYSTPNAWIDGSNRCLGPLHTKAVRLEVVDKMPNVIFKRIATGLHQAKVHPTMYCTLARLTPGFFRDIMILKAFENAITLVNVLGGSTNAVRDSL